MYWNALMGFLDDSILKIIIVNTFFYYLKHNLPPSSISEITKPQRSVHKGPYILEQKRKRHSFQSVALFPICVFILQWFQSEIIGFRFRFRFRSSINAP